MVDICLAERTASGVSSRSRRDLVVGGIALEDLGEDRLGAGEPDELRVLVERDADASASARRGP